MNMLRNGKGGDDWIGLWMATSSFPRHCVAVAVRFWDPVCLYVCNFSDVTPSFLTSLKGALPSIENVLFRLRKEIVARVTAHWLKRPKRRAYDTKLHVGTFYLEPHFRRGLSSLVGYNENDYWSLELHYNRPCQSGTENPQRRLVRLLFTQFFTDPALARLRNCKPLVRAPRGTAPCDPQDKIGASRAVSSTKSAVRHWPLSRLDAQSCKHNARHQWIIGTQMAPRPDYRQTYVHDVFIGLPANGCSWLKTCNPQSWKCGNTQAAIDWCHVAWRRIMPLVSVSWLAVEQPIANDALQSGKVWK